MKGWGKSPPRRRQRRRHGKPRLEQDQIGTSRGFARRVHRPGRPGRSREPLSNGRSRGMIVAVSSDAEQNPAYRPSGILFYWAYRPSAYLRPVSRAFHPPIRWWLARCLGPISDYPRISVFWQRSRRLAVVNLLSGQGRLERCTGCEYFVCSVYVPCVQSYLSRHTSKHG